MVNQLLLPKATWSGLTGALLKLRTSQDAKLANDDQIFLEQIGLMKDGTLSDTGAELCNLIHVRHDNSTADTITHDALQIAPATQALLQALIGVKDVTVDQARMALLFAGLAEAEADARLTNFLTILNANRVIVYNRKARSIQLLVSPKQSTAPSHIYVDRTRPYSNDLWIREVLRECQGSIKWLDKYFQKEAFEWIWREASADKISRIQIISTVGDEEVDALALADYKRLKKELGLKGITLEWKVLKRNESHDFHDRWIIDDNDLCYNVPSINSIKSGQRSELHRSPNYAKIQISFDQYFATATSV